MPADHSPSHPDPQLAARIEELLADAGLQDNPLRAPLAELYAAFSEQNRQMDRIAHIADRYQAAERQRGVRYAHDYHDQIRRLEKIVRISDRYQDMMRDLNERLQWLSSRDVLTGLPNRRFTLQRLNEEFARAQRSGRSFSLILADIDHFKDINDTLGHEAGDQALAAVAARLSGSVRDYDVCARWGGEEFLVLLPDTAPDAARDSAERLRARAADEPFVIGEAQRRITLSFGVGSSVPDEALVALIKRVDDALYAAKRGGRNCIAHAAPPESVREAPAPRAPGEA
jgi:diguanylate cyclase (GGDEF)-like protein